jgi:PAS domain S-box-containing protein
MDRPTREVLKLVPLFSKFNDETLSRLIHHVKEVHYKKGDILFRENSIGDTFYIIKRGSVQIYREGKEGKEPMKLALRRSGDFFGEMALIENSPRFATAEVAADSQILELSKQAFSLLLSEVPTVAFDMMSVMAARLRESDLQAIRELKAKNVSLENLSRQLEESKNYLQRIITVSPDIAVVTDGEGRITIFNHAAQLIYGYPDEEVVGKEVSMLHSPNCPEEALRELKSSLESNTTYSGELIDIRRDGEEFINQVTACNIMGQNENLLGILYLGKDITEAKELHRQAQKLDQMATRGQMAAEVAHELNNYISVLSGNLELIAFDIEGQRIDAIGKKIDTMSQAVDRMMVFTRGLMSYAQPEYKFRKLALNQFLEGELAFLRPQKRFRCIKISTELDPGIKTIPADPAGLQQILYNLLNNAADAISNARIKDGAILIKTSLAKEGDREYVVMRVIDNGPGMSPEQREKAFKHGFTTKAGGHGFGLMTIKNIAKIHEAEVTVESEPGQGAEFIITLPLAGPKSNPELSKPRLQLEEMR